MYLWVSFVYYDKPKDFFKIYLSYEVFTKKLNEIF